MSDGARDQDGIAAWLAAYIGGVLRIDPETLDRHASFDALGLDSAVAVVLAGELEELLEIELDPEIAYDHASIAELSSYLASLIQPQAAATSATGVE